MAEIQKQLDDSSTKLTNNDQHQSTNDIKLDGDTPPNTDEKELINNNMQQEVELKSNPSPSPEPIDITIYMNSISIAWKQGIINASDITIP